MLSERVDVLKGIGKKTKEDLALMNIHTIEDLLYYFPYRYDIQEIKPLRKLVHGEQATIVGTIVTEPQVLYGRKRRTVFNVKVDEAVVRVVMFHRLYSTDRLTTGATITLTGKWDAHRLQMTVHSFKFGKPESGTEINALYSVKGNLTNNRFRMLLKQALERYTDHVEEILPEKYLTAYRLPERKTALKTIHFPENSYALKHAKRRFIYEELLLYQLKIHTYKKQQKEARKSEPIPIAKEKVNAFIKRLPFTLTKSQMRSLKEILADIASEQQMYRLLQGDVGSGKTAVAAISLYSVAASGYQGALMVPTEILAEQHFASMKTLLGDEVNAALLTSSVKGKKRAEILSGLKDGSIQIVIGTHSLIQEEVKFNRLGLVIIDEQHRFGVEQRRLLFEKGEAPNVLHMTATPIPRTLAITAFGELDISTIDEMPSGRKRVLTYVVNEHYLERILRFVMKKVAAGEQAYFVSPLIEESEAFDYENAVDLYNKLVSYFPSSIKVGLLHGKLKNDEKEAIMKQFVKNEIQVLVATTVIEVGVNVPNATVMVIHDAERFGLAQLHQLRGRVGRGDKQAYCILIADPKNEVGKERMRIIAETNDGFRLAEADLKLRGPGDFFGKKQSGLPEFKIADPIEDFRALEVARRDAIDIVAHHKLETDPDYRHLKRIVDKTLTEPFD